MNLELTTFSHVTWRKHLLIMIRLIQQTGFNFHHTILEVKNKTLFYLMWNGPSESRDEPAPQIVSLEFLENIPDKFKERLSSRYRKALFIFIYYFGLGYATIY